MKKEYLKTSSASVRSWRGTAREEHAGFNSCMRDASRRWCDVRRAANVFGLKQSMLSAAWIAGQLEGTSLCRGGVLGSVLKKDTKDGHKAGEFMPAARWTTAKVIRYFLAAAKVYATGEKVESK